jgi:hypothetical protein
MDDGQHWKHIKREGYPMPSKGGGTNKICCQKVAAHFIFAIKKWRHKRILKFLKT